MQFCSVQDIICSEIKKYIFIKKKPTLSSEPNIDFVGWWTTLHSMPE